MNNPSIHNQVRISQDLDILNGAEDGSPQEKGGVRPCALYLLLLHTVLIPSENYFILIPSEKY